jgi:cytochrome c553
MMVSQLTVSERQRSINAGNQVWKTWTVPGPGEPGNDAWKGASEQQHSEEVAAGRELSNGTCAHCHGPDAVMVERRIIFASCNAAIAKRWMRHRVHRDARTS